MNVTVAIDSFKGSLSTFEAGAAIADGIRDYMPDAEVNICPIADGGEGTTDAIVSATGGQMITVEVSDPIGRRISASYGITKDGKTAVIEMASAAGITLVNEKERNPLDTTTYGVGEMISNAIERGCRNFVVGIGGSATNDGGVGMLSALGFEFLDSNSNPVAKGAKGLEDICTIKVENANPKLSECSFSIACDVTNPLCGPNGCSAVFGPQKGATAEMVADMDLWLSNYARLTKDIIKTTDENYPGTGAAGGMGFAFVAYLGAVLKSGIELVMEQTGLEEYIKKADIVITGEGRLDFQSCMGKAPVGVASLAKKYSKPVVALAGCVTPEAKKCNESGIDAFFPILKAPCTLDEAMDKSNAYGNLRDTACQVMRLACVFERNIGD